MCLEYCDISQWRNWKSCSRVGAFPLEPSQWKIWPRIFFVYMRFLRCYCRGISRRNFSTVLENLSGSRKITLSTHFWVKIFPREIFRHVAVFGNNCMPSCNNEDVAIVNYITAEHYRAERQLFRRKFLQKLFHVKLFKMWYNQIVERNLNYKFSRSVWIAIGAYFTKSHNWKP